MKRWSEFGPEFKHALHGRLFYEDHLYRPCEVLCDVVQWLHFTPMKISVIFTESNDNEGPSITNTAEAAVLAFCNSCKMSLDQADFFERYESHPDDLDRMIFKIEKSGRPVDLYWQRCDPFFAKRIFRCIDGVS